MLPNNALWPWLMPFELPAVIGQRWQNNAIFFSFFFYCSWLPFLLFYYYQLRDGPASLSPSSLQLPFWLPQKLLSRNKLTNNISEWISSACYVHRYPINTHTHSPTEAGNSFEMNSIRDCFTCLLLLLLLPLLQRLLTPTIRQIIPDFNDHVIQFCEPAPVVYFHFEPVVKPKNALVICLCWMVYSSCCCCSCWLKIFQK